MDRSESGWTATPSGWTKKSEYRLCDTLPKLILATALKWVFLCSSSLILLGLINSFSEDWFLPILFKFVGELLAVLDP